MEAYNPTSDNKYYRFLGFEAETESGLLVNTYEESVLDARMPAD